jgi:ABC-type uncharacterized transport system auxiliary subunit
LATSAQPVIPAANAEIIRVDRPTATQLLSTNDIVVTDGGQKLSAIAQSQWAEVTPVLVQGVLVEALESSPQFIGLNPTTGAKTSTRVHLVIKNFEANFDNGPESAPLAVVHYSATYARSGDRTLLGTHTVRKTMRASSINVSSIVAAIEQANDAAMIDIVTWLEGQKRQVGS